MMDLNFFQSTTKQEIDNVSKKVLIGGSTIVGLFIGTTLIFNCISIGRTKGAIEDLNTKMKDKEFVAEYNKSLQSAKESSAYTSYNDTLNDIYVLISDRDKIKPYLLRDISYSIPKEVYLSSINVEGGIVTISARATSRVAIAEFQHNLGELGFIEDTHISTIASDMADNNEVFTFDINCGLKEEYYNETK